MNAHPPRRLDVLVMHPDPIVRAGLVAALRQQPTFRILVHGVDRLASDAAIDVVVADYDNAMLLAHPDGGRMHGPLAEGRIVAFTAKDREADIRRAIRSGIHGYLVLGGPVDELIEGVTAVGRGVRYLGLGVARRMADSLAAVTLTARENEVLQLVATGQSNKAVARLLGIEVGTVKSHVSAIMSKLGAVSRTQAASIAVARGLLDEGLPTFSAPVAKRGHMAEMRLHPA